MPYWDWSLESATPYKSELWNTNLAGIGGNGSPTTMCVEEGTFSEGQWFLPVSSGDSNLCLKRRFNNSIPDFVTVLEVKQKKYYKFFEFE